MFGWLKKLLKDEGLVEARVHATKMGEEGA